MKIIIRLSFFIAIITILSIIDTKIIELDITRSTDKINFIIGNKNCEFFIDLEENYSCINKYRSLLPNTSKIIDANNYTLSRDNRNYTYQIAKDTFKSNDPFFQLDNFHFYYFPDFSTRYNKISLGYNIQDKSLSIVYLAYKNGIINKPQFGVKIGKDLEYSKIFLGGFPPEYIHHKNKGYCNVYSISSKWACQLNSVYVNEKKYNNKELVLFTNLYDRMYVPFKFLQFMKEAIEEKGIECILLDGGSLNCEEKVKLLTEVKLIFNRYKLNFKGNELFQKNIGEMYICDFHNFTSKHQDYPWTMGESFIQKFSCVFDYQSNTITFYAKDITTSLNSLIIIHYTNVIFIFISTIFIITIKLIYN